MKTHPLKALLASAVLLISFASNAAETGPAAAPAPYPDRLQWWTDARFGMFIHWGPVSLKGTEIGWSRGAQVPTAEYDTLYEHFNPTNFNAGQWVKIAKQAGMKYIVLTTKHHDGFCLWDTKFTDYNIMNTPFHRDVTRELAEACRQQGIVFCAYHSICDWRHPDYPLGSPGGKSKKPDANLDRYNQHLKDQLAELLKNYGPLGVLWFDGEWESPWTAERGQDLYRHCRSLQDSLIINNRVSKGREGMAGTTAQTRENPGDYDTPEQTIGKFQDQRPWETCMTICNQWAWKPNDPMKSLPDCLHALIRCAGGDGNLLFNVGPMPTGEIESCQIERLQEMGAWLAKNGESIYGTRGGPWKSTKTLASTRKGSTIYLHLLDLSKSTLTLPPLPRKIKDATVLAGGRVGFNQTDQAVEITLPAPQLDPIDTIIKLELDGSAMDIPALTVRPIVSETRVKELQNLRWGMFVCWSFSTFSGKEWTPGITNLALFNPTGCDSEQWVKTAKEAGMGYLLFLTKHHDGFCLWDTKTTDRKVTKSPLARDVLAELKKSCDQHGVKLALYFSEGDWTWAGSVPGGKSGPNPEIKKAQLRELLTQYGPIEYIWFDHAVGDGGLSHTETTAFCKALQPDCFIGFNHGPPAGDIRLGELGHPSPLTDETGSGFNAKYIKGYTGHRLAEFTYPIQPKHAGGAMWFYSLPKHDQLCLPAEKLYADYLGAVKCGNIFSLDVGPDYAGKLRDIDVQTLRQVGEMIQTKASPPTKP